MEEDKNIIPKEVLGIAGQLGKAGFAAYLVGGCVRDLLMNREPKDWDITTDANPEEIQKLFPDSIYENKLGTVGVKTESEGERLRVVEVTTFRLEGKYTDKRHPDEIKFAETIKEDLSRRDFTTNAIAVEVGSGKVEMGKVIDPFGGQSDLKVKIIRAVGNPEERFSEDALRLMRAVRFAVQLNFEIERKTEAAIKNHASLLEMIAKERIRDEFIKIIMTPRAAEGIQILEGLGLLKHIMPELCEGIGVGQNRHHVYSVWEHQIRTLDYAAQNNFPLHLRLASLLHDISKPRTKSGEGPYSTFYNHDIVGAKVTAKILDRLAFPKSLIEQVVHLVRYHMFYYNVGEVTESGVRRFLARVGPESVPDLMKLREADRIGSGVPKAVPYKLRHLQFMIEKVKRDPISPKMLKVKGEDVMKIAKLEPGPRVGQILAVLLEEVLDDPTLNTSDHLTVRIKELIKLSEKELAQLAQQARERKDEFESGVEEGIKKKYYVK